MDSSHSSSDSGDVAVRLKEERRIVIGHRLDTSDPLSYTTFDESHPPLPVSQEDLTSVLVANTPSERMVTLWLRGFDLRDNDLSALSAWNDISELIFANCNIQGLDLGQLDSILDIKTNIGLSLMIYGGLVGDRLTIPQIKIMQLLLVRNIAVDVLDLATAGSQRFKILRCNHLAIKEVILPENSRSGLKSIDLGHNQISDIDLGNAANWPINMLNLEDNELRSIDLAPLNGNAEYTNDLKLSLADNKLESIDLSVLHGRKVAELNFRGNPLRELDVSHITWGQIVEDFNVNPDVRIIGKPDWMLEHEMEERMWEEENGE